MNTLLTWSLGCLFAAYIGVSFLMWYLTPPIREDNKAAVVVLGDIGHSPRMCNHVLSIAKAGCPVDFIGYVQSDLRPELLDNPLITIKQLPDPLKRGQMSYAMYALKRAFLEHFSLYKAIKASKPTVILVQNPPSIPTLGVARLMSIFVLPGCKLVIDWHNLGYTILQLTQPRAKWLIRAYRLYEMVFGRIAYLHLCVSVKLGMSLKTKFAINPKRVIPLPDRPVDAHFVGNKFSVRERLNLGDPKAKWVVTSTSYTPDEDLGMLLKALKSYNGPQINIVVTGKGPGKAAFEQEIASSVFPNATINLAWLSYADYFDLLAACDLGVSLHKSSSGWDLPMKAVDMFACGLPVLSVEYPAITELVKPKENGLLFTNAEELAKCLKVLDDRAQLTKLRKNAEKEALNNWTDMWNVKVGPVFGYGRYTGEESSSDSD